MGTLIPATVAPTQLGTAYQKETGLLQKYAWQLDRGTQGNKTATIKRYTMTGASYFAHVEPTYSLVANLTNLPVWVDSYSKDYAERHGGVDKTSKDKMFVFYDVTGDIQADDLIIYDSDEYTIVSIWIDAATGRNEARATLTRGSTS